MNPMMDDDGVGVGNASDECDYVHHFRGNATEQAS